MFWRRRQDRDLEDELAFHQAHLGDRQDLFGGADRIGEECRDQRRGAWLDGVARDLRHGWRSLRRQRGWTLITLITLALGIGATSAAFSLVYAALLRPLPFPQTSRLVWIGASSKRLQLEDQILATPSELRAWTQDLQRLFSGYGWLSRGGTGSIWEIEGRAAVPLTRSASVNLFPLLGVRPVLGRLFREGEDTDAAPRVALISYEYWRSAFGGDPGAVGKVIQQRFGPPEGTRIVGVLPPSFHLEQTIEMWLPARPQHATEEYRAYFVIGRRRPGVTVAEVATVMAGLERRNPAPQDYRVGRTDWVPVVMALQERLRGPLRLPLGLLFAAVSCLLLLACANVANLQLARNQQRGGELALRLALGCSRPRLIRQLLIEGAMLAIAGAVIGAAAAAAGLRALLASGTVLLPADAAQTLVSLQATVLGPATLGFTAVLTGLVLAGFGLGPAWRASAWDLRSRVAAATVGKPMRRLVVLEVTLATVLVVGAGLLGRSFTTLAGVYPGFDVGQRVSVQVDLPAIGDACRGPACAKLRETQRAAYLDQVLDHLRALPGVTAASATGTLPLDNADGPGLPDGPPDLNDVFPSMVTPGYFPVMGTRLVAGRDFNSSDVLGAPMGIIVNQTFARRFFPGQPVIGLHVQVARCRINNPTPDQGCTIIGVVADVHEDSLALAPQPAAYVTFDQDATTGLTFVVRSSRPARSVIADIERLLPQLPLFAGQRPFVFPPRSLQATVAASIAAPRFRSWLSALLAALALALAAVGVLGVQAYAVARRTPEIGTRMALGAGRGDIARLVMRETLLWTVTGAATGLALGLGASRLLASFLFQVHSWDPWTLLGAPLLLLGTAVLAAWLPARRAARVDPATALRAE